MGFLKDLPLFVSGPLLIGTLVVVSLLGLHWFRKVQMPRLRIHENDEHFLAAIHASIMVFYGLATALTAVQVWEVYEKVRDITEQEASALAALYRNVSEYPEPVRGVLREELRVYTHQIIHESWALQRRGKVPSELVRSMEELHTTLAKFEPVTEAQKALVLEGLSSYSRMMEVRRMRMSSVDRGLPGVLWLVIVLGAVISLASTFYFPVRDANVHRIQVGLLAGFIGLVIFMVLALDQPYRGDLGLKATPYELVYDQLMTR